MSDPRGLQAALASALDRAREAGLLRTLGDTTSSGIDFTSNDVLGLSRHPVVVAAACEATKRHGTGGRASRLLGGGSPQDRSVEQAAAEWLGAESALLFASGYHANLGLIGALVGRGDVVLADALVHASLVDAIRLSRARPVIYAHADPDDLQRRLECLGRRGPGRGRTLVVTESLFSMDGDVAPLGAIGAICARYGASLVVDEAHACGVVGPEGAGGWAALAPSEVAPDVLAARVVTGGKALGAAGALVVSSGIVRDALIQRARTLAFTTAPPPAVVAALGAAIPLARQADEARTRVHGMARALSEACGLEARAGAIVPIPLGSAHAALEAGRRLQAAGFDVRAVRPPTVPEGTSRLRVVCHAFNSEDDLQRLLAAMRDAGIRPAPSPEPARTPRSARPLVVCGTDTGVGKTVVSALLTAAAARHGEAAYWKPVQTGDESDTDAVRALVPRNAPFAPDPRFAFARPASPHEAAAAEDREVDVDAIDAALVEHLETLGSGRLITELAGGLLVPWTLDVTQLDWLGRRRLPVVLVARSGLGTLNHVLLSLEALRRRHLEPRALFLVGPRHDANRETLASMTHLPAIYEVPWLDPLDADGVAAWVDDHDLDSIWLEPRA